MSLLDELLQEKKTKVLSSLPKQELVEVNGVTVVVDNPNNKIIKEILITDGQFVKSTPSSITYINNIRNKKIALILSKYGNPEI